MCLEEIGLCAQNMMAISGSTIDIIGGIRPLISVRISTSISIRAPKNYEKESSALIWAC